MSTGERLRTVMVDRDSMGTWSVYAVFDRASGRHVATIHGPDTAGWSVNMPGVTNRGWGGSAPTLADARDTVEERLARLRHEGKPVPEMEGKRCACGARFGWPEEFNSHIRFTERRAQKGHSPRPPERVPQWLAATEADPAKAEELEARDAYEGARAFWIGHDRPPQVYVWARGMTHRRPFVFEADEFGAVVP